jgi:hypothetical protein
MMQGAILQRPWGYVLSAEMRGLVDSDRASS